MRIALDATPLSVSTGAAPYFLFVGTIEPRKNVPLMIEAWREVRKQCDIELVLVGRRRADGPEIPGEPGIRCLGAVADGQLASLYTGAKAFVYPSQYEGFGLPILEAMQCGALVICSRDPAVSEVAGGAAVQVASDNPKELAEAMLAVLRDPGSFEDLRLRAIKRAAEFSWNRTAARTREVYEEARARFRH